MGRYKKDHYQKQYLEAYQNDFDNVVVSELMEQLSWLDTLINLLISKLSTSKIPVISDNTNPLESLISAKGKIIGLIKNNQNDNDFSKKSLGDILKDYDVNTNYLTQVKQDNVPITLLAKKACSKCHQKFPISAFYKKGKDNVCKYCRSEEAKIYYKNKKSNVEECQD